ncbi:DarT ssDNA thymidine ADP-ribosyltransferase family protein [Neisseria dentiae]|uniref:DarT ssDNA thymidine ADP-ribosyltransferase family protein n=1 Tax=Neisseria dentiae TaxID=194197 RepID=UPI0035A14CFD
MTIGDILHERNIRYLCHFTRLENLESILKHGLYPRTQIFNQDLNPDVRSNIQGIFNDTVRADNKMNAICLSISFPNSKMFYKLRCEQGDTQWAVIVLNAQVLLDKDCAFYPTNAANNCVRHLPIENFQGDNALNALFNEADEERQPLLPKDPTDVQAEVLVFEQIEPSYIVGCVFNSDDLRDKYSNKFSNYQFESTWRKWGVFDDRFQARKHGFKGH